MIVDKMTLIKTKRPVCQYKVNQNQKKISSKSEKNYMNMLKSNIGAPKKECIIMCKEKSLLLYSLDDGPRKRGDQHLTNE